MSVSVEELLCRWAAAKLDVPRDEVVSVAFRHEDGWSDDGSGTHWPEENTAVVKMTSSDREIPIDGLEGLPGLIREILGSS